MTIKEKALLLATAKALLSLMGWGNAGPDERAKLRKAIEAVETEQ